jgi:uncharacterized phage protein (TIGR02220 family)
MPRLHVSGGGFTIVPNEIARSKDMTSAAKGRLVELMSMSDGWRFNKAYFYKSSKDGKDATNRQLRELEELGYLHIAPAKGLDGRFTPGDWYLYLSPDENPFFHAEPIEEKEQEQMTLDLLGTKETAKADHTEEIVTRVLEHLNERAGKSLSTKAEGNRKHARARLREGYTEADLTKVVDVKCREWGRTDMARYIRPQTLFSAEHFDVYLHQDDDRKRDDDGGWSDANGW